MHLLLTIWRVLLVHCCFTAAYATWSVQEFQRDPVKCHPKYSERAQATRRWQVHCQFAKHSQGRCTSIWLHVCHFYLPSARQRPQHPRIAPHAKTSYENESRHSNSQTYNPPHWAHIKARGRHRPCRWPQHDTCSQTWHRCGHRGGKRESGPSGTLRQHT